jgi:hypothetical protein
MFPALAPTPFVATYAGIRQGVYHQRFPNVPLPFGGSTDLSLLGVSDDVELSFKITDWFAISGFAQALAVIGSNGKSILYAGGNLNAGGSIVPVFRLARVESTGTQVSFRASVGWLPGDSIDIPDFLLAAGPTVAAAQSSPTPQAIPGAIATSVLDNGIERTLLVRTDTFILTGGFAAAQTITHELGVQAGLAFERAVYGATSNVLPSGDVRVSDTRYDLLFDVAVDWNGVTIGIPVAVQAEYELNGRLHSTGSELLEGTSNVANVLGAGVYYSGAQDLQLGIFGAYAFGLRPLQGIGGAPSSSDDSQADYLQVVIRHIW